MPTPVIRASPLRSSSSRVTTLLVIALSVAALYFAKTILLPLAVAALISFVLAPWADRLERFRIGRVASTVMMVAATFAILGGVSWAVTDQAVQLSANLPQYKQNLLGKIHDLQPKSNSIVDRASKTLSEIGAELHLTPPPQPDRTAPPVSNPQDSQVQPVRVVEMPPTTSWAQVWAVIEPIFEPLANLAIIVVLITFILLRREDLRNRLIELVGRSDLGASTEALSEATQRVTRYLRTALLINTLYGAAIAAGLAVIGLPNPLLWGVLGLALRFLPYIGPMLAGAMPVMLSLVVFNGWVQPLLVLSLIIVLELIVNLALEPLLYASGTGVSPIGVILAAMFWTWLWGPVGLVVAVPLTVCLVVAANYVPQLRFIAVLLGEQSMMSAPELIYQRLLALDDEEASELVRKEVTQTPLAEFYDSVLLPTLALIQRDREADRLEEDRFSLVIDGLRDLTDEAAAASPPADDAGELADAPIQSRARVLCVSACGPLCEIAATMLKHTLTRQGLDVRVSATQLLANELVDHVREEEFDIVVISALPPLAARSGRYLLKKIRQGHAELPVVVGLWHGHQLTKARQRFDADGATEVVSSIREAARAVRQIAVRMPLGAPREPVIAVDGAIPGVRVPRPHHEPGEVVG